MGIARATTRKRVCVQSDVNAFYRNPNVYLILPVTRAYDYIRTTHTENFTGTGTALFPGDITVNFDFGPIFTLTFTTTLQDDPVADVLPLYQEFLTDDRWNPNWRVSFLVHPGLYSVTGFVTTPVTPVMMTPWQKADDALATLEALPNDYLRETVDRTLSPLDPLVRPGGISDLNWNAFLAGELASGHDPLYEPGSVLSPSPATGYTINLADKDLSIAETNEALTAATGYRGSQAIFFDVNAMWLFDLAGSFTGTIPMRDVLLEKDIMWWTEADEVSMSFPGFSWFLAGETNGKANLLLQTDPVNVWKAFSYVYAKYLRPVL